MAREQRRLAAILAADVVGYSRLMGRDESGTLARLKAHRTQRLEPVLARHGGRLVKLTGDGALAEFPSAVDALSAAIEFQQAMAEANRDQPKDTAIVFRIGLHLGDLIVDGDDLYGDGVNVAARLEAEAPAGGIVISGDVHNAVAGRLKATFDDLGGLALKNIERPIQAFGVKWDPAEWKVSTVAKAAPSITTTANTDISLALPDKPSIAVLPFQNMSGDPEQEYFADGMVEDIITALSRTRQLFVIARNSSFAYKGRSPDIRQVGRELGVAYVLEGSVRKGGDRVRITGQLIEAASGAHIWADRFEGDLKDVFELQDRVTSNVVASMMPNLERAEIARSQRRPTENLKAYDYYLRGRASFLRFTNEGNDEALAFYYKAIEADLKFALAFAYASVCYAQRKGWGWRIADPSDEVIEAERLARRALELDRSDPRVLAYAGWTTSFLCQRIEEGTALIAAAVERDPNLFYAWNYRGWTSLFLGDNRAIEHFRHALRLSPLHPSLFGIYGGMAASHFLLGDYEQTVSWGTKVLAEYPKQISTLWFVAAALGLAGRLDEARAACETIRSVIPTVRLSNLKTWMTVARDDLLDELKEGLRLAGMPE